MRSRIINQKVITVEINIITFRETTVQLEKAKVKVEKIMRRKEFEKTYEERKRRKTFNSDILTFEENLIKQIKKFRDDKNTQKIQ